MGERDLALAGCETLTAALFAGTVVGFVDELESESLSESDSEDDDSSELLSGSG